MLQRPLPYSFIAIEGNIGAGKTTLSRMLAEAYGRRLILEQFSDNPFLPYFYENPERYAFTVELFFMTERHKQLQEELSQSQLFHEGIITDYFFLKTLLFAKNNLKDDEYRLFQRLFHILNANFPKPDLLVYLHRPVDGLLANIRKRGRGMEQRIAPDYLAQIQQAYFEFFRTTPGLPVLIIDLEDADFVAYPEHYEAIRELLHHEYSPELHRVKIG
ncbi:MAG: deoxynucleoside kinase [Lewinella sp.]|nr:deoxynucleoside kinase [Lewinella sp.]